jgi:hypothetical protein
VPQAAPAPVAVGADARAAAEELRVQRSGERRYVTGKQAERQAPRRLSGDAAYRPQAGIDWIAVLLGILAAALLLGLIPLYLRVFTLL